MTLLDQFRKNLPRSTFVPNFKPLIKAIEANAELFKDLNPGPPPEALIRDAFRKFLMLAKGKQGGCGLSWMEMAVLCWSLRNPHNGVTILSNAGMFNALMNCVHEKQKEGSFTSYPWHGLYIAYMGFSPWADPDKTVEQENWNKLGKFLHSSFKKLKEETSFTPRWMDAISQYQFVLNGDVTTELAQKLLALGSMQNELSQQLDLPATSWFWPRLLLRQVELLAKQDNAAFKRDLIKVLPEINKHKLNEAMVEVLERYAKCDTTEANDDLKLAAIGLWGSPMIPSNAKAKWLVWVSDDVLAMVKRWQITGFVREFFKDSANGVRRFEFWMQFLNQITNLYLALGADGRKKFTGLIKNQNEHHYTLTGAGAGNNAFIIQIGNNYFVEFGEFGKCWAYTEQTIRPVLRFKSIGYNELRNPDASLFTDDDGNKNGISHRGQWENRLLPAIDELGGIPDILSLPQIIDRYELVSEKRSTGDTWVRAKNGNKAITNDGILGTLLTKYGFNFIARNQAFYRAHNWSHTMAVCPGCGTNLKITPNKPGFAICPSCHTNFPVSV